MTSETSLSLDKPDIYGKNVTAVLGPTNTGKTHLAIERMLAHQSGLIGFPLRLLAREVYDRVVAQIGPADVALITGEERIKPENPRYYICTVEAMPRDIEVDFLAIDEIQLAADQERGHVFTNRLFTARGKEETLLLGSLTMRDAIAELLPVSNYISRPRLSKLTYGGQKKITRLPRRTAIVAFSANEVYEIAELIRRQRGGAAVVLGALSPRTRNAQVALYQSGDVDFLVATDAIGMGLNLDIDHVAFAGVRKYDGQLHRLLTASELGQIAGRAGRHTNDGTFGVTGNVEPFEPELINNLENHEYEPVKLLQWRNSDLDFSTLENLKASLKVAPTKPRLVRARLTDDVVALENVTLDKTIKDIAKSPANIKLLWEACQVPDYQKISSANHAELITQLYKYTTSETGTIPEDWLAQQVELADKTEGDIDTLANRIAHIRTWTFVSNRYGWLEDPEHWRNKTKDIEDRLSDALHERLMARFVDQRTSTLMKRMQDSDDLYAEINEDGAIYVEKHFVGKIEGFRFTPDTNGDGIHGKAARNAAAKVLIKELGMRVRRVSAAKSDAFKLNSRGRIEWRNEEIAKIEKGENPLSPVVQILADEHLQAPDRDKVHERVSHWLKEQIDERLKPLVNISNADDVTGLGRGIAFQLCENFGILKRENVADDIRSLDQTARAKLRKYGVRFGAFNIYFPILLKPAAVELLLVLWTLKDGESHNVTFDEMPQPPRAGLTSVAAEKSVPDAFYRASGYQRCGRRAVRIDMLERLADMIRPLTSWRDGKSEGDKPTGATGDGGFLAQPDMMSIMGCSAEELGAVLTSLGFRMEKRLVKEVPVEDKQDSAENVVDTAGGLDSKDTEEKTDGSQSIEATDTSSYDNSETVDKKEEIVKTADEGIGDQKALETAEKDSTPDDISKDDSKALETVADGEAVEAESQYEEVWRPQKRKQHQQPHQNKKRQNFNKQGKSETFERKDGDRGAQKAKGKGKPYKNNKNNNRKPKNNALKQYSAKPDKIDPNSPFAALSKLKENMETKDQNRKEQTDNT